MNGNSRDYDDLLVAADYKQKYNTEESEMENTTNTNTTTEKENTTMNEQYIIDRITEELGNVTVQFTETPKNNVICKGISIKENNSNLGLNIYYNENDSDDEIAEKIINIYRANEENGTPFDINDVESIVKDWNRAKNVILPALYNITRSVYKDDIVTTDFTSDLGIYFRIIVGNNKNGMSSIKVTSQFVDNWGVTVDELLAVAKANLNKELMIKDLGQLLMEMMGGPNDMIREVDTVERMSVMTNNSKMFGASAMLCIPDVIANGELEDKDYYIIPSSIHEVIVVNPDSLSPEQLNGMIMEVNETQVSAEDFLSNYALKYDSATGKIEVAA